MVNVIPTRSTSTRQPSFLAARENPLCLKWVTSVRYRFAQYDWNWHLARLRRLNYRAAIVGKRGTGKTTLLFELRDRLTASGIENHHVFLPQETADHTNLIAEALSKSHHGHVILVDGIARLRYSQRQKLFRKTKHRSGVVVSVHTACRLPTWIQTETNPALISDILRDLQLDLPDVQAAAQTAFTKSNGNIRDALADLYDQFASGRFNETLAR